MTHQAHITAHAIERAMERVPGITNEAQARVLLSSAAIMLAAQFSVQVWVRLATGHRVVVKDGSVVTVLPSDHYRRDTRRLAKGRYE